MFSVLNGAEMFGEAYISGPLKLYVMAGKLKKTERGYVNYPRVPAGWTGMWGLIQPAVVLYRWAALINSKTN
jgi:hypothetical protein